MDISKLLTAGEWLEVEGVEGYEDFGAFKLKIAPLDPMAYFDLLAQTKELPGDFLDERAREKVANFISLILELVKDWDFMNDGEKVECTPETKGLYLQRLLWRRVKGEDTILLRKILEFSFNPQNYAKN